MRLTLGLTLGALLAGAVALSGQSQDITSYRVNYYNPGASAPMQQSDVFTASTVQCGQPPLTSTTTVNPGRAFWTDPADPAKVCIYTFQPVGNVLTALPVGAYEATLIAINTVGESAESNRAPFTRAALPPARTGFSFAR